MKWFTVNVSTIPEHTIEDRDPEAVNFKSSVFELTNMGSYCMFFVYDPDHEKWMWVSSNDCKLESVDDSE